MKKLVYSFLLALLLSSCGDSTWEGAYVVDMEAFKNSPQLKAQKRAGDDLAFMMMQGALNKMDLCVIVEGDSSFTFGSFGAASSYSSSLVKKEEKGISFTNEQGTSMTLMKGDSGVQLFNGVMNLPMKKIIGEEKDKYTALLKEKKAEAALRTANEKKLASVLDIKLIDKGFYEYKYRDYITFTIEMKNLSGREIAAFKGDLVFSDLLDNQVKRISFMYDEGIGSGELKEYKAHIDHNDYSPDSRALKDKPMDKLKIRWIPAQVLFSDGEKIGE